MRKLGIPDHLPCFRAVHEDDEDLYEEDEEDPFWSWTCQLIPAQWTRRQISKARKAMEIGS